MSQINLNFLNEEAKIEFIKIFGENADKYLLMDFVKYKSQGITVQEHEIKIIQEVKKLLRNHRINLYEMDISTHENWPGLLLVWFNGEEVDPEWYENKSSADYIIEDITKKIASDNVMVTDTCCGSFSISVKIKRDSSLFK